MNAAQGRVIYLPGLPAADSPTLEETVDDETARYHQRVQALRAEEQEARPWQRPRTS